jgi:hypothetical protein
MWCEISTTLAVFWRRVSYSEGTAWVGACEKIEDGLPDGRHARLWRRCADSFFSVPLL